ncbi:MAG TPA: shikimate dehydrogenase [Reyranellaceae bacterium]|nr:shikimate dehydrogenase [Reyranellaceae bacterium]
MTITNARPLVGLIGANIQRSRAPALFEDACAAVGLRGHYHLMDLDLLPGRTAADLLAAARTVGLSGFNVTYPCKEIVLPLLDEVSEEARQIGAVNTVTIGKDGRTTGYNTDRIGFRRSLEETFGREAVEGKTVLMVGAGGAGRAVAFALSDLGVRELLIHDNRTAQAEAVAEAITRHVGGGRARVVADPAAVLGSVAGVVNATPVGMTGIPGVPLDVATLGAIVWVADVIYSPLETELLKHARARGARTMGGAGMCVHQAAESFRLFTGRTADVERMRCTFVAAGGPS